MIILSDKDNITVNVFPSYLYGDHMCRMFRAGDINKLQTFHFMEIMLDLMLYQSYLDTLIEYNFLIKGLIFRHGLRHIPNFHYILYHPFTNLE